MAFAQFRRVLVPGGSLLLGFHVGDERRRGQGDEHPMALSLSLLRPERIPELGVAAGLELEGSLRGEGKQACLLLRKPVTGGAGARPTG
ncbi:hypothetical protein ACFYNO_24815 [Kitasatospora sp. NPDC006697]|uniref:hypothetical protein n=1 Tax=Kitasatospora sp. NPDC006697 TaxID=3364020 RepID=UPI0036C1E760